MIADGDGQMKQELPDRYSLQPAYPNPFNPTTQLNFTLPERAPVTVRIYNLQAGDFAETRRVTLIK